MPLRATPLRAATAIALFLVGLSAVAKPAPSHSREARENFLERYCQRCHGGDRTKGGFDISDLEAPGSARWSDVIDRLEWGEMPPTGEVQPTESELLAFLKASAARISKDVPDLALEDAKPRALRRLGIREYRSAIVDVLDVDLDVADFLPPDDVAHGYDVVGEGLSLTPNHLERYLIAAERIAARAVVLPEEADPEERLVQSPDFELSRDFHQYLDTKTETHWRSLSSSGSVGSRFILDADGPYVLRIRASADQAGSDLAAYDVRVDGTPRHRGEVPVERPEERSLDIELDLVAGEHFIEVAFVNDYYKPKAKDKGERDRNLLIASLTLVGPIDRSHPTHLQEILRGEDGDLESAVTQLARRLFRRPVTPKELRPYLKLSKRSDSFELRLRVALTAMLVSPHFLITGAEPEGFHTASGLSWFLWRSAPDDELLRAAERGELGVRSGREAQVERMLRAARASSLAHSFSSQWLQLGRLDETAPDPRRYSKFDEELREAMRAESLLCFEAILRENRPVSELLDSEWTFVNERLAQHYGFPGVEGSAMRRVPIPGALRDRRGGLLGQAGPLCVTSNPTRTSPVKRGKWILEALLDSAPPPPPPGVDDLEEGEEARDEASLRERLELHREKPECATCHLSMDALGLGLENFDAIGRWREKDGPHEIDAAAVLPDGRAFEGPGELRTLLASDRAFLRSLAKNLAVYALGRGLERADEAAISSLLKALPAEPSLKDLILGIVELPGFRQAGAGSGLNRPEDEESKR